MTSAEIARGLVFASLLMGTACVATPLPSATPTSDASPTATPGDVTGSPPQPTAPASATPMAAPLALRIGLIDVGRPAFAVAIDPRSGHAYVRTDVGIASVDPVARAVMSRLEGLGSPGLSAGLAFDEELGFLYVSSRDGRVTVLRPANDGGLALVATVRLAEELGPIAIDARTHNVYVLDMGIQAGVRGDPPRPGGLFVISGNTRTVVGRLDMPGDPLAIAVDSSTGRAYVSLRVAPQVEYVIQVLSLDPMSEIARVGTSIAVDLALHPRTGLLYGPDPGAPGVGLRGRITVFDTRNNQAATFVSDIGAHVLANDWIRDHLYAADIDGHITIGRLRGPAQPPSTFERLGVTGKPMGLAADPHRRLFYVAILEGRLAIFRDDHP